MEYKILKITIDENIQLITISRTEALNALNTRFFDELNYCLDNLNPEIKVLILTGDGKAFVAGADIAEMVDKTPEQATAFSEYGQKTMRRLELLPIPVIAAVGGFALGGGCELTMACDIRIASNKAKFGQPEVNLGVIPGYAGTQRLSRLIGLGNALFLLMTADAISAQDALRMGLVQKVCEHDQLLTETMELAKKIASKGPNAVKLVKHVTRTGLEMDFDAASKMEAQYFGSLFGNEAKEGMTAFLEKRQPKW